jgi:hypothetical protein
VPRSEFARARDIADATKMVAKVDLPKNPKVDLTKTAKKQTL